MKIALYNVTTAYAARGIESAIWELSRVYTEQCHEVEIISGTGTLNPYADHALRMFPSIRRNHLSFLPPVPSKFIERLSLLVSAFPHLARTRYDVFIIFKPLDLPAAWILKLIHPKMKVIFFSGGLDFMYIDRYANKVFDSICAPSEHNAVILRKRYERPVTLVIYGINSERFAPSPELRRKGREMLGLTDGTTALLSVGEMIAWKGHAVVIRALPSLPDMRFFLIGTGEERDALQSLARELGVADRVTFLGKIPSEDIPTYMNAADLFVHPSVGQEPLGLVILEALSSGLPVVGSNTGGIPEIVTDGSNGYLFETGNDTELAEKIRLALSQRDTLAQNARASVVSAYSWKGAAEKLLSSLG